MSLSAKDQKRIIQQESAWVDKDFAGVDLSSYPALQPPPPESSPDDGKFARSYFDNPLTRSGTDLKRFVESPDAEALTDLASADPEIAEQLEDRIAEDVAEKFLRSNPDYLRTDRNFQTILDFLTNRYLRREIDEFKTGDDAIRQLMRVGAWNPEGITNAYRQLLRQGSLVVPANQPRSLTDRELAQCAQLAANGDVIGAVCSYLQHRISEDVADEVSFSLMAPESFTSDPQFRPYIDEALLFAWENSRVDYSPNETRRGFLRNYIGGRFVTIALLDAAWEACKKHEADGSRDRLFNSTPVNEPPVNEKNLDALDDAAVDHLYHATLKHYARTAPKTSPMYA